MKVQKKKYDFEKLNTHLSDIWGIVTTWHNIFRLNAWRLQYYCMLCHEIRSF